VTAILERPGASSFTVSSDRGPSLETQTVILATPAFVTARLTRDLAPDLSELCAAIPYASSATVALGFPRGAIRHPLNGSGFVVPVVEGTGIMAASWLSSKWPHRAPEGRVLLRAFIGGARDPRSLDRSDEDLIDTSLRALTPLLGIVGAPMLSKVYRWERASAQHEVGHLARVAAIDRVLERRPGLFVTGSGFRGVGIPDCVGDGRRTARAATEYLQREQERVKR
jgi:oxygen-dependent protoporphyrinogen oxidase